MVYKEISGIFYPKKIFEKYKEILMYAGVEMDPRRFLGFILIFGFLLGWVIAFFSEKIFDINLLLSFIIAFIAVEVIIYLWFVLKVEAKARFVERVLPDTLQLMSSNLRAGLTPDRALLLAARPEFGPLTTELNIVGKEITLGKSIDEALLDIPKRIKSHKVEKTIMLIVSGIRAGGELATLLDYTSRNIRDQDFVEQKVRSSVMMYVIFIFAAIGLGAPMLYGLSSFLVQVLTNIFSQIDIPETSTMNMPISIAQVSVDVDFVIKYIIISLIITSILGSMILGLISKGEEKQGLKYAPFMVAFSLIVFFTVRFLIMTFTSGLFGF